MANDPEALLPAPGEAVPAPAPRVRLVCEHCRCQLTPTGDVLRMSDEARGHLRHAEDKAKLEKRIADLETELSEARRQLAEYATVRESKHRFDLEI